MIVRIIVMFFSRLFDKNINEERNNNFYLYLNFVLSFSCSFKGNSWVYGDFRRFINIFMI